MLHWFHAALTYATQAAAKLDISEISQDVNNLSAGMKQVSEELSHHAQLKSGAALEGAALEGDRFVEMTEPFVQSAAPQLEELQRVSGELQQAPGPFGSAFGSAFKIASKVDR